MCPEDDNDTAVLRYVLPSRPEAVRDTLGVLRQDLAALGLSSDDLGTCELVLAEAMNNIVEHAYQESDDGQLRMSLKPLPGRLDIRIEDDGFAMPNGALPEGKLASLEVDRDELPEGGFGWFLIRNMTRDLRYCRKDGVNLLTFSLPLSA